MRISDWSSDVCSSDLQGGGGRRHERGTALRRTGARGPVSDPDRLHRVDARRRLAGDGGAVGRVREAAAEPRGLRLRGDAVALHHPLSDADQPRVAARRNPQRSEEHTSELQSLMRISYAVFCLKKKKKKLHQKQKY